MTTPHGTSEDTQDEARSSNPPPRRGSRLVDRARELWEGLLDAGDALAAGVFGPRPQPALIPVRRRPRR
jgi:hypothetical protein